jgi:competence protein ComEC
VFSASALAAARLWTGTPVPPPGDVARRADDRELRVRGRLAGDADVQADRARFVLRVAAVAGEAEGWEPASGRARVTVLDPSFDGGWGDDAEFKGRLYRPYPAPVPGAFDDRAFLAEKDVHSRLIVFPGNWTVTRRAPAWSPARWVSRCRRAVLGTFERRLGPHEAAVMAGLCLGKKPASDPRLESWFRRAGLYHLLVASGSNVGFVVGLWLFVARWALFLPRRAAWALCVPWAFLYAGLAGNDPPVMRAAVMVSLGIAGHLLARFDRVEHAVGFSALVMLLARPASLFEAGTQMSYAATFGVVMAVPALEGTSSRLYSTWPKPAAWSARTVARLFLVSAAAQWALSPLLIHYFHRLSWAGLLSNALAVPWAAVCLALGFALAPLDAAAPSWFLTRWTARAADFAADGLLNLAEFFARPAWAESMVVWPAHRAVGWAVIVAAALAALASRGRRGALWASAALAGAALLFWPSGGGAGRLSVAWLDVGLGDAVVVTSPAGRVSLVDAGNEAAGAHRLAPFLRARGVRRIRRVVLTHGDPPHAGGLRPLLAEFAVEEFVCSRWAWREKAWSETRETVERLGLRPRFAEAGRAWEEDGVRWEVLWPADGAPPDPDGRALVVRLRHGSQSVLLTSDLAPAAQRALARPRRRARVWQWPDHGRPPPDPDLLAASGARWTVLSAARPSAYVGSAAWAVPYRWTGDSGAVEWVSDGARSGLDVSRAAAD